MQSFKLKFLGVTILQGVKFPIFLLIFEWSLQQCSATALPVIGEKKRKIRATTPFKVIQGHWDRYQSKARMRLPISDWHLIAAYCSNFGYFAFLASPFGGLGATFNDHLRLIGERVVDYFVLVLIERFSLGVTAEAIRANIGWKSAIYCRYKNLDTFLSFCYNLRIWQTDRQTDGQLSHRYTASACHAAR